MPCLEGTKAVEPDGVAVARILDEGASYLAVVTSGDIWLSPVSPRSKARENGSSKTLGRSISVDCRIPRHHPLSACHALVARSGNNRPSP
jgi:hypothetical protein